MIDFELEPQVPSRLQMYHAVSEHMMRPISRECDEHEHVKPTKFYESMWSASAADIQVGNDKSKKSDASAGVRRPKRQSVDRAQHRGACWGDAGLYLSTPNSGLGARLFWRRGRPNRRSVLKRFREGKPKWGAMAITEPGFGSDSRGDDHGHARR